MEISSTPVAERSNPVHGFAGAALRAVDRVVAGSPGWAMSAVEQAETLVELTRLQAQITELTWRVLAAADRTRSAPPPRPAPRGGWPGRPGRRGCGRMRRSAARCCSTTRDTPRRGRRSRPDLTEDQVWVILRTLEDLPTDEVTSADRERAQKHLIELAGAHDAEQLRVLALRLFEVLAPEEADKREREALERQERRAREKCRFAVRLNGDGTASGWFKLPSLQADMLTKAVQAFAAPRRTDPRWTTSPPVWVRPRWTPAPRSRRARHAAWRATPG